MLISQIDEQTDRQTHSSQPHKIKVDTKIHAWKIFFLYFILSYLKFTIDLQNTQTQNLNNQKNENPNQPLGFLGADV